VLPRERVIRRVLLTGGAGFIGSHVAEALLRHGAELTIVDSLDNFYAEGKKRANLREIEESGAYEFVQTDICDAEALGAVVRRSQPDCIVHLAARAGVRPSIEQPALYETVNVLGTVNLLEAARKFHVKKFIFGSSSSVYGESGTVPFKESEAQMRPISPYAATKLAGEMICHTYAHLHRLSILCLRFFTVYGPRQRPDLAIHKFTALMEAGQRIPVFGDGSTGRDYTYVEDIAAGVLAAVDYEPSGYMAGDTPFDIVNLGNSHPVKLLELIEELERATGKKALRDQQPAQPGDVSITWADISKAQRLLKYEPRTKLTEGLKKFVSWYRAHQEIPA
jgi:UDP-glucuronate 4-epimerase